MPHLLGQHGRVHRQRLPVRTVFWPWSSAAC